MTALDHWSDGRLQSSSKLNRTALNIILVEDDDADARALHRVFKKARIANPVIRFADGAEALTFLRRERNQVHPPHFLAPYDIKMPPKKGNELRSEFRANPFLHNNLFLMLAPSDDERDISEAYEKMSLASFRSLRLAICLLNLRLRSTIFGALPNHQKTHVREVADGSSQNPAH
ncbi:two-component system response regulator [Leisingera sp. JC1]|uniref:two-component system response regulator n=1 Tax=Leisingera sp. JC1 TaxID=1855282 RepID=UPI0020C81AF2|nr:two-component system response regulator [Leisingera sp. JC1]